MTATVSFPKTFDSMGELVFAIAQPGEDREIFEFFMEHFFPVVPIGQICQMDVNLEVRPWAHGFISKVLKQGRSLTVRDSSNRNRLAAVILNQVEEKSSPPESLVHWVDPDQHPLMMMNAVFLETLGQGVDFFSEYGVERVLDVTILAVSHLYASRGLASKLIQLSIEKAHQEDGVRVFKTEAVSEYATRALNKIGFITIKEIPYQDFDYKGTKPLIGLVETDHKKGRLMVLEI